VLDGRHRDRKHVATVGNRTDVPPIGDRRAVAALGDRLHAAVFVELVGWAHVVSETSGRARARILASSPPHADTRFPPKLVKLHLGGALESPEAELVAIVANDTSDEPRG
jgi:hypothetical protein